MVPIQPLALPVNNAEYQRMEVPNTWAFMKLSYLCLPSCVSLGLSILYYYTAVLVQQSCHDNSSNQITEMMKDPSPQHVVAVLWFTAWPLDAVDKTAKSCIGKCWQMLDVANNHSAAFITTAIIQYLICKFSILACPATQDR